MSSPCVVAFAIGDPAGIGAELAARLLAAPQQDDTVLLGIGDHRVLERGASHAGVRVTLPVVPLAGLDEVRPETSIFVDLENCDPDTVEMGCASAAGGRSALGNFRAALLAAREGYADAVMFTPFNKQAMRMAEADYVDEIGFVARTLGTDTRGSEFNVLDEVWNARVTSHIPLGAVAEALSTGRVYDSLKLTVQVMQGAGVARPRIGVAALNPHAGDGRNFGSEDEDVILPAVERARTEQMAVTGPVPADTVFVRALAGEFDAVLTMYHDQGQIAMKLIGFDRGVTLIAGFPFPIVTPAHGTAYDIAGRGTANLGASAQALALARRLAGQAAGDAKARPPLTEIMRQALAAGRAA